MDFDKKYEQLKSQLALHFNINTSKFELMEMGCVTETAAHMLELLEDSDNRKLFNKLNTFIAENCEVIGVVAPRLILTNSENGTFGFKPTRIVCSNKMAGEK